MIRDEKQAGASLCVGLGGLKKNLFGAALALGLAGNACQAAPPPAAIAAIDPALVQYVLSDVPTDVPNRCYFDFGGKVALVGYAIEPVGIATPGSHVKLTLYWQSLSPLGPGWGLFTHLLIPRQPHRVLDGSGPLRKSVPAEGGGERQALGPSSWERGKVYVDPLEFDIPMNVRAPEVSVAAGVWRDALHVVKDGEKEDPQLALPGLRRHAARHHPAHQHRPARSVAAHIGAASPRTGQPGGRQTSSPERSEWRSLTAARAAAASRYRWRCSRRASAIRRTRTTRKKPPRD
jgi:hypothetical protein